MNYFSEEFSSRLDKFNFRAREIVQGFMLGLHKSPFHGFSAEFSEHKQYNIGDSLKKIDWKIFAKTNRYYIKQYEEETNLTCNIMLDHSLSMEYSSGNITKLEYAKAIASVLNYLLLKQNDAVGLVTFNDKITINIPPKALLKHFAIINKHLFNLSASGQTKSSEVLHQMAGQIKKRGMVIIITDLLDNLENIVQGLQHFRYQKQEVIVFHIEDPQEENFDFKYETEFIDLETKEKLLISPLQIQKEYKKHKLKHQNELKNKLWESKIDYHYVSTSTSFEDIIIKLLIKRSKIF